MLVNTAMAAGWGGVEVVADGCVDGEGSRNVGNPIKALTAGQRHSIQIPSQSVKVGHCRC